jgi:hypothetical protein
MPAHAGAGHDHRYLGWERGQPQGSADKPGMAPDADQDRKAAGVYVLYCRQIDDQVTGITDQAAELLTQSGS